MGETPSCTESVAGGLRLVSGHSRIARGRLGTREQHRELLAQFHLGLAHGGPVEMGASAAEEIEDE